MHTTPKTQDLLTLAKVIIPYEKYQNTLLDTAQESITEPESLLADMGFCMVNSFCQRSNSRFLLDFSGSNNVAPEYIHNEYYYINNVDGSMRWVFPKTLSTPTFLNFYTISSWKSKAYAFGIRLAFKLMLQKRICSGSFHLYSKEQPYFQRYLKSSHSDSYSFFMGTVGPNRKVVMGLNKGNKTTHYIKIAINEASRELLQNEFKKLDKIEDLGLQRLYEPFSYLFSDNRALIQSSLQSSISKRSKQWTSLHTMAKLEMEVKSIGRSVLTSEYATKLKSKLQPLLKSNFVDPAIKRIAIKAEMVATELTRNNEVLPTSLCHNDFTPWNMFVEKDLLRVYDWELAEYAPVLSDLFHFHMQKGVMMEKKSYSMIWKDIQEILEQEEWKSFLNTQHIDARFQFSIYLLNTVSYYTGIYTQQNALHWQAIALLQVWEDALNETIAWQQPHTFRRQFIFSFFNALSEQKYVCLKFIYGSLDNLPESSDLDVLVAEQALELGIAHIHSSPLTNHVKLVRKSFMTTAHIFFKDGSFLSIDMLTTFKHTNLAFMNAEEVLNYRQLEGGLCVSHPKHDFEYAFLFYQLNRSHLPQRYCDYFSNTPERVQKEIGNYISSKYCLSFTKLSELYAASQSIRQRVQQKISFSKPNLGFHAVRNNWNYLKDMTRNLVYNRGFVLTVSGVDGAGKSTIITEVKTLLESKYRKKVIVLRHRPSVLPILSAWVHGKENAEKKTMERLPRTGNNQSQVKSFFRFGYYLLDYLVGQFYVYFKYILRSKIIVYDRYYFDFISDAKRSNIVIHPSIPKWFYTFVHKPELNIFLYAPAAEILKRKQELKEKEIEELTSSYQCLFDDFASRDSSRTYLSIQNLRLEETLLKIESNITLCLKRNSA